MIKSLPTYFRDKYTLLGTVTFTAFFSLLILMLCMPFLGNAWFALGINKAFGLTAGFYFTSLGIIIISKWVMYLTRAKVNMDYLGYVGWNLAETILICILYTGISIYGRQQGIIEYESHGPLSLFASALVFAFICIIVPYTISGLFFSLVDKNKTIRLMNTRDVVTDQIADSETDSRKITLYDNSGVMKLSVSVENLYYIESDDNYVIVWYSDSRGAMKKYMIRCRLKTIEESFRGSSLVRCHRKYIVNMDKVKVLRKEKDGYELDLENDAIPPISITKTYAENVLSRFDVNA
ncbi:MAG: LytTR family transcriptional regulator [Bacteroidales bacterium]|nr:LytTR family transcriptional regulator [Bacteroidales bacterium]